MSGATEPDTRAKVAFTCSKKSETIDTRVRLADVDTPVADGKCVEERALALRAKERLAALAGSRVRLTDIRRGKYAGRVVADVWVDGERLADLLVAEGLGRPYDGGKRAGWC